MSLKSKTFAFLYQKFFKPLAFSLDAEIVHDAITFFGESLENHPAIVSWLFSQNQPKSTKRILGLNFENPIGLAAGFDNNGHLAKVLKYVGFGFNTVGTVTAKPYKGNPKPRLLRLPKSRSLLVNKGFKSDGAEKIAFRLDKKKLNGHLIGISVGSSNIPEVNTIGKAIEDYLVTFNLFKEKKYVKYFELNISCPNAVLSESFAEKKFFLDLVKHIADLKIRQPIFVKMPNEITFQNTDDLIKTALKYGIRGFIFSNLVKNRQNPAFDREEIEKIASFEGNFSGRPTFKNSNRLISHARQKFGRQIVIIGCGGVFSPRDALEKLKAGADLIQLITGMIFRGPQLIGEISRHIATQ